MEVNFYKSANSSEGETENSGPPLNPPINLLPLLKTRTDSCWIAAVNADLVSLLQDHAACERKAASNCMSFIVSYPRIHSLCDQMIKMAREELEHFNQVFQILANRGFSLANDSKNLYVNGLLEKVRLSSKERLLDRLIVAALIEARSCERFFAAAQGLADQEIAQFYGVLAKAELRHNMVYMQLAYELFDTTIVKERTLEFLDHEDEVFRALPLRAVMH